MHEDDGDKKSVTWTPTDDDLREFLATWHTRSGTLSQALGGEGASCGDSTRPTMLRNVLEFYRTTNKPKSAMGSAMRVVLDAWTRFIAGRQEPAPASGAGEAVAPLGSPATPEPEDRPDLERKLRDELPDQARLPGLDDGSAATCGVGPAAPRTRAPTLHQRFDEVNTTAETSTDVSTAAAGTALDGKKPADRDPPALAGLEDIEGLECLCPYGNYWLCRIPQDAWPANPEIEQELDGPLVDQLAAAFGLVRQLHPVITHYENGVLDLIGGRHRLQAARRRGDTHVLALVTVEPDPAKRSLITLLENTTRSHDPARRDQLVLQQEDLLRKLNLESVTNCDEARSNPTKSQTSTERMRHHRARKRLMDVIAAVSEAYMAGKIKQVAVDRIAKLAREQQAEALKLELEQAATKKHTKRSRKAKPAGDEDAAQDTGTDAGADQAPAPASTSGGPTTGQAVPGIEKDLLVKTIKWLAGRISTHSPDEVKDGALRTALVGCVDDVILLQTHLPDWADAIRWWMAGLDTDGRDPRGTPSK